MSAGWQALNEVIEEARARIAAIAPDAATAAEGEAYVTRAAAVGLGSAMLGHTLREGGLLRALPCWGGPNPDYIMRHTLLHPDSRYVLTGRLNGSERVGVGLYRIGPNGAPLTAAYTSYNAADHEPGETFTLEIAREPSTPDGLAIPPDAQILLIRVLHRTQEEAARLNLTGGPDTPGLSLPRGSNEAALAFVAAGIRNNIDEYLKWTDAALAMPNRIGSAPDHLTATVNSDADTTYFLGGFDLQPGEWLEVTMTPDTKGYWSLHVYNVWYENLQTPGAHDRNTTPDEDGMIRIAVGPELPPGARNRIETLGRRRGAFVCRLIGGGACPTTVVRKRDE